MSAEKAVGRTGNKKGGNKGIAARRKEQRRIEAEERNKRTPRERRRVYRDGPVSKRKKAA